MTDLLEAESRLTPGPWEFDGPDKWGNWQFRGPGVIFASNLTSTKGVTPTQEAADALVFIRNNLRPVLEATLSRMATWESRYDELASLLGCKDDTSADDVAARLIDVLERAQLIEEAARNLLQVLSVIDLRDADNMIHDEAVVHQAANELSYALRTAPAQGSEDG